MYSQTVSKDVESCFIIQKSNKFISVGRDNTIGLCGEKTNATRFRYDAANNIVNNQIKPSERSECKILHIGTVDEVIENERSVFMKGLNFYAKTRMAQKIEELSGIISMCDRIVLDIRHFARDSSTRLNACQAAKAFYKLQEVERTRLCAKKELSALYEFEKGFNRLLILSDSYEYPPYKPRYIDDMEEYIGI